MNITVDDAAHPDWRALPDHILGTIFRYLCEQDRYNASQVCRSWSHGFSSPESWRRFTLDITRMKKHHHRSRKKSYRSTDSLPLNMLVVVARRVHFLKVFCPWASDDRSGSGGVSHRLSDALGDLRYRGCQLRKLSLYNFDRMLTSWRDSKARLRVVKALKRFINSQRNLAVLDLSYSRFYPRELLILLKAATYHSAAAVTSINLKASYCHIVLPEAEEQPYHHDHFNVYPNRVNNEEVDRHFILGNQEDQYEREWPIRLGKLFSRFTYLRSLRLLLDVNVLRMDLLTNLPSTFTLLDFYIRRSETETEEFNNALNGNPLCDSNKWSTLTKRCPQLKLAVQTRNIVWYMPIYYILPHSVPLKEINVFAPRDLSNSLELLGILHYIIDCFHNTLEDVRINVTIPMDDVLPKFFNNCRSLKSLHVRCTLKNPDIVNDFFCALSMGQIKVSQVQLIIETTSNVHFQQYNSIKSEFMKILIKEENMSTNEIHGTHLWIKGKPIQTIKFWALRNPRYAHKRKSHS